MPIISVDERAIYFPELADLEWSVVQALQSQAEAIAWSPQGANRNLSITTYRETPKIGRDCVVRLKYTPIQIESLTPVIEIRGRAVHDGFQRYSPNGEWVLLDSTAYEIDPDINEIRFLDLPILGLETRFSGTRTPRSAPAGIPVEWLQLRLKYAAGYDFNADPQPTEVLAIKSAIAGLSNLMNSSAAKGVSKMDIKDIYEFSVSYSANAGAIASSKASGGSQFEQWLMILKQFRPRETLR